jgi:hypothetical protein
MATKRNLVETSVSGKTEPDPSVLPEIISTGLLILALAAFGSCSCAVRRHWEEC